MNTSRRTIATVALATTTALAVAGVAAYASTTSSPAAARVPASAIPAAVPAAALPAAAAPAAAAAVSAAAAPAAAAPAAGAAFSAAGAPAAGGAVPAVKAPAAPKHGAKVTTGYVSFDLPYGWHQTTKTFYAADSYKQWTTPQAGGFKTAGTLCVSAVSASDGCSVEVDVPSVLHLPVPEFNLANTHQGFSHNSSVLCDTTAGDTVGYRTSRVTVDGYPATKAVWNADCHGSSFVATMWQLDNGVQIVAQNADSANAISSVLQTVKVG